jgi:hypothetical protein
MSADHDVGHLPSPAEILRATDRPLPRTLKLACAVLALLGALVFIVGLFVAPDRVWRAFHANWLFFASVSSAGVMFVAVQRITTARWSRPIVRMLEGYAAFLPVAFLFLLLSLTVGANHIFPWTREQPPVAEKVFWLNQPFVALRALLWFGAITAFSLWFVYTSLRLDVGRVPEAGAGWARGLRDRMRRGLGEERREIHSTHSLQGRIAAPLAVLWGFGWMALFFDLSMALDMHFFSTLYGWWGFMTGWLGALASWSLIVMLWRRYLNTYDLITETHFHDLGKLCFAFTAFWGYLTFGQYLIIWYGNLPEETNFFRLRLISPWKEITFSVGMLVFVAPFFGLMSRAAKVYLPTFILFAASILIGTWLQRYTEVYPSLYGRPAGLPFGLWELGVLALYLGTWGLCYASFMDAFPRMRVTLMTSPYRDEVQVPYDPRTMEPRPAHE